MPALRKAASSRPCSASTCATTASLAARSVTSRTTNGQPRSAATCRLRSLSRSARTTVTSSARSLVARARPKPPVPPVMRATEPGAGVVGRVILAGARRDVPGAARMPRSSVTRIMREEAVQHPDAELQRLDRHPLVDAVEQRGEVEVRRQPQRGEPEAAHAEPLEALGVGAAAHRERHRARAVVLGLERGDHLVDQRAVERRLHGLVVDDPVALDALADQPGELALELLLLAVEEAAVDGGAGGAGDDVGLVAGVEHRGVDRVAQRRADHPADAAEPGQRLLGLRRGRSRCRRRRSTAARKSRIGGVSTVGKPVRAEPGDGLAEPGDGVVVVHERAVAGLAAGGEPHPGQALLGGLHEVEAQVVADGDAEAADLADRLGAALEQVGVLVDQPAGAELAAGLLVGDVGQHDVARRLDAGAGPVADQRQDHGVHVLHVDRAAAPDVAVALLAGERVDAPLGRIGGDDVEVAVHEQRRAARRSAPAMRATRLARPGSDSWISDSMPTSASLQATHSAAARSPALVAVSPVFVVSMRMRSESSSATSSWAPARGCGVGSAHVGDPATGGPPTAVEARLC